MFGAICFTNCSDSFLDLENTSGLSPAYFPKSMSDMELLVNTCYAQVNRTELYGALVMTKGSFIVDHTADMAWTADDAWNQQARNELTSDNQNIQMLWQGYYKVVSAANTVLEELESIDRSNFTNDNLARLSQMEGEALFWRGWGHQQLVQFWGEGYPCNGDGDKAGIPLRLNVPNTPSLLNIERSSVNDVYAQIVSDYEDAEKLLPPSWSNRADMPRPSKYAVKSYLGQVKLYMGDNEGAKTALKDVIDNSGKELVPFEEYKNMFNEHQTKYNRESILEINFKNGSATGYGNWSGGEGSMHSLVAATCFINASGNVEAGGWGNIFFHDANIERFGSDPRLHVVALKPGTPIKAYGNDTVISQYKDIEPDMKGWSLAKYNPITFVPNEMAASVGINMYLMRLADVYLMYAEACQLSGDESTAREYLNRVRRRAYSGDTTVDITSSGTQLRDDIREERFYEFCAESVQHWVDVCRWKTLEQEIDQWYPKTRVGTIKFDPHDLYYPIPMKELEDNPSAKQSTGY